MLSINLPCSLSMLLQNTSTVSPDLVVLTHTDPPDRERASASVLMLIPLPGKEASLCGQDVASASSILRSRWMFPTP